MTKVLIVEDDAAIAMGLEDDLAAEGYAVEVVADGAVASHRAREGGIDVILLDVMLPGKDGFTLCREWRKAGIETPILMLTARAEQAEKVLGLELGADDYVTKPFGTHELRARIKAGRAARFHEQAGVPLRRLRTGFRPRRIAEKRRRG
jgi:DNA-binding response OmpR family regulator